MPTTTPASRAGGQVRRSAGTAVAAAVITTMLVLAQLPASAEAPPTALLSWVVDASEAPVFGSCDDPGLTTDPSGGVYVSDPGGSRVQRFTSTGTAQGAWGTAGTGPGQIDAPHEIAHDGAGHVYVTNFVSNRVQKFTSAGTFVTEWGSAGNGPGQFRGIGGIAADGNGNVYVTDIRNRRVQKFTSTGVFVGQWGSEGSGPGQFIAPRGLAVDSSGAVYVADWGNSRIQKFTPSGAFITSWNSAGTGNGVLDHPSAIAIGPGDKVYVLDSLNYRVVKYTATGGAVSTWGDPDLFSCPSSVAADAEGNVYVSDSASAFNGDIRVRKFGTAVTRPDARVRRGANGTQVGDNIYNTDGTDQTTTGTAPRGQKVNYIITAQNDAAVADKLKIRGHSSNSAFAVRYYDTAGTVITPQIVAGTYTTRRLNPGQSVDIRMEITLKTNAPPPACPLPCHELLTRPVTIASKANPNQTDTIRTTTTRLN